VHLRKVAHVTLEAEAEIYGIQGPVDGVSELRRELPTTRSLISAERVPVGRRTRGMLLGARRGLAWSVSQQHPRSGQRGKVHQKCPGSGFRPKILLYRGALIKA
jgi:hypothetical protein